MNDGRNFASGQQRPNVFFQLVGNLRFVLRASRPQRRACESQAFGHKRDPIDFNFGRLKKRNLQQAPFNGQRLQVALDVAAAHHVQNGVHTFLVGELQNLFDKVLCFVIDRDMRAGL